MSGVDLDCSSPETRRVRVGAFGAVVVLAVAWLALVASAAPLRAADPGLEPGSPRIRAVERRGSEVVIRAQVPAGIARVVLEACRRNDFAGWAPRAVARVAASETEVTFTVPATGALEMFRVRADASDPLPAAFYAGRTNYPGAVAQGGVETLDRMNAGGVGAPPGATDEAGAARSVVESDIWVVRDDTLYFFNQYRGLQILDIADPDAPAVKGTFALPGAGEQMYLLDDRHAVLLAHDPCQAWSTEAESSVIVVDTAAKPPVDLARLPVKGRIVESRLVGTALYVASETWQTRSDGSGVWESGTYVTSFDLANPATPAPRKSLWFPGSGNVVTATDRFLFVATLDYSTQWPWRTDLQVVDITSPDGEMAPFVRIPLAGRVADKFKLDLLDDVLRVVVEATETANAARWVTVLETYRLADPRAAGPVSYAKLDRLELARGERLFGTRFDGTRGYVVTYLVKDPLWVIDLSDPADLRIAGELVIPGYSTYLRPMGDRLLTLGIDDVQGWRVAVQLFDVSNPAKPTLLSKVPLGENSSWSEATQDEKAFGVFPEAGLLLVPVSSWSGEASHQGVQLIDYAPDSLKARGLLASESVVPRRAAYHRERVLAVSGRELVSADVRDRDHPEVNASLELAYPVERVLLAGGYLLEFDQTTVRARPLAGDVDQARVTSLGELPVLGAVVRGTRLHLLQGRQATVVYEAQPGTDTWQPRTNAGVLQASVWSLADLPALTRLGESSVAVEREWLPEVRPVWAREDLLVWATSPTTFFRMWWMPGVLAEDAVVGRLGGRFWWPWWGNGKRLLRPVEVAGDGTPKLLPEQELGGAGEAVGEVASAGSLLYSSRRIQESQVVGTNLVVEQVWVASDPVRVTNVVVTPDGGTKTEVSERTDGSWRTVTNGYPVLRWWSRHELDVVDYSGGASDPVVRPPVEVGGQLRGVSHDGALLYTTADRQEADDQPQKSWLEASAYDGVAAFRVDSLAVADSAASEGYAVTTRGADIFVARGGWDAKAVQRLETWRLSAAGRWEKTSTTPLSVAPGELAVFGDLLLARNGGTHELFSIDPPTAPAPLTVVAPPGCYGGDLGHADGDRSRGLWLPLGDYGAVRIGP
jgi:hypothetical protein